MKESERSTSVERVIGAIRGGHADRIARGEITIDDRVVEDALGCDRVGFEERLQFCDLLGLDICCLTSQVSSPAKALARPSDFLWPDLRSWIDHSGLFTFAVLDGSFGWGVRTFGWKEFFTLSMTNPDALLDFNRRIEILNSELAHRLADQGIHGLILADDIAHRNGLFVGPGAIRKYFLPCLARQAEQMLSTGVSVFFHSDGDFRELLSEITALGFHGLHCLDPESGMDLNEVRSRVGPRLCLWGTLTVRELENGIDECGAAVQKIRRAASDGSFILGTTSGLFAGLNIEALRGLYKKIDSGYGSQRSVVGPAACR